MASPSQQAKSDLMDGFQAIFPGSSQTIAVATASAGSTILSGTIARLYSTTDCYIKIGQGAQTATSSHMFLPASTVEYFAIHPGDFIAAIRATADGTLYITEGA